MNMLPFWNQVRGWDYPGYEDLKATLDQFRIESGAYYVYILTDMDPDDDYFEITVDGSEEPDDWMYQYEIEGQFLVAQNGEPCAALSAWDNDVDDPVWSAFAPVHDSEGNVVGILGVDYPAPEILDFPGVEQGFRTSGTEWKWNLIIT